MPYISRWDQGVILPLSGMAAVFADGMGLGAVGIVPKGRSWRVVAGPRAERIRLSARRWYCVNLERAQMIAHDVRASLEKLPTPIAAEDAAALCEATAQRLGIVLAAEDRIREHAERIVSQVEATFESLVARGELKSVNAGYRQYRLATTLAGKKPIGYQTFIANYKTGLVRAAAQHSRINVFENAK